MEVENITQKTPFRPVRGTESAIKKTSPIDGYIYFTTDTKKIYIGKDGKFLSMGGNSGVFYGNKDFNIQEDPTDFCFSLEDLDTSTLPNINDLIINVAGTSTDGFYRVIEIISENMVRCSLIAVSTGGGGGGESGASGFAKIDRITLSPAETIINKDFFIEYELTAQDSSGETILTPGTATWRVNNEVVATEKIAVGRNKTKIDSFLDSARGLNIVTLSISIDTGGSRNTIVTKTWEITAIDLRLQWDWDYSEKSYIDQDNFTLFWTAFGGVDYIAHITIDDNLGTDGNSYHIPIDKKESGKKVSYTLKSLSYGNHKVSIYISAVINQIEYNTEPITNILTFIKGGNTPILTVPFYQENATQYDTITIPFLVYDPRNEECVVELWANGIKVSSDLYDKKLHQWAYMIDTDGLNHFMLKVSGNIYHEFTIQVSPLKLDVEEPKGKIFGLQANKISGNDGLRSWNENGITLSFSDNFDWENGGLKVEKDDNGQLRKFIKIKNNTSMTINYNLFANRGEQNGKNFKIIFKTANCYKYDAEFLNCYDSQNKVGIRMNAQRAIFTSTAQSLTSDYFEDSYIELENEIWKRENKANGTNYMMIWTDGVPSGVKVYTESDTFLQVRPQPIVIGSPDCDVYIYLVKVYEKQLNSREHLDNFIIDAQDPKELISRYERNNILNPNGEISYEKLAQSSKECRVHLYDIPRMTKKKKDYVVAQYKQYLNSDKPCLVGKNVVLHVQGTSSAKYGVAAFNLDTEFTDKHTPNNSPAPEIEDGNGNRIPSNSFAMTPNSIPVNYFCTKVNVASCEGINNAINAEWYNRYQPYIDGHRRKNPKARDCMEFHPGVVFMKDNNPVKFDGTNNYVDTNMFSEIPNYIKNPYYKMYAIGCMGNSKKNINVFHDEDNPKACCVEVNDNQNSEHWMTVHVDETSFNERGGQKPFYEFRYPDGNDKASVEMKQAWLDFVNWMAASNPAAATKEPLGKTVHFEPYTFKGYAPPGFELPEHSATSLQGYTCATYAGDYTTDTYEYRMAKMLSECEDHLVMDSVVYHYLFIERHTMVDNVAKNTFWSSEDLKHWDLTKNYDNDTSDGNDNSGFMTLTYGYECLDKKNEHEYVFNSHNAVWLNFIHGLYGPCQDLYNKLSNISMPDGTKQSAWDPKNYLKLCKEFQDCIPECCWIEDYYRKYLRPRELGLDYSKNPGSEEIDTDSPYLKRLEGGKKTHQRKQYEIYQAQYLDSKYRSGIAHDTFIEIRANANKEDSQSIILPMQVYTDSYAWIEIGQQPIHERVKRGQEFNLKIDKIGDLNDATVYIYNAQMLQKINNLQAFHIKVIDTGKANKLREIQIGDESPEYLNASLTSANFAANTMLEKLNVSNCYNGQPGQNLGTLNLKAITNLKDLRIKGSDYTELKLAPGATIQTMHLNALSIFEAAKLHQLKEVIFDKEIYNTLTTLDIDDCPLIDTQTLVEKSKNLSQYSLLKVNWKISNEQLSSDSSLQRLSILDKLLSINTQGQGSTTATSLTGNVLIDINCNANEYTLYSLYSKYYPNLKISYSPKVNLQKAPKILFMSDSKNSLNNKPYYTVLGDGQKTIEFLISAEGPTGIALSSPIKPSTDKNDFLFTNSWVNEEGISYTSEQLNRLVPTETNKPYIFYPKYETKIRSYKVEFKDKDNIIYKQDLPWGTVLSSIPEIPKLISRNSDKLASFERWTFKGWSQIQYQDNIIPSKPQYLNLETMKVEGPITAYSHFIIEDARLTPTDNKYFIFKPTIVSKLELGISQTSGYSISINPEYRDIISGKITLPSSYMNENIIEIQDFRNTYNITDIFFENYNTTNYLSIAKNAFSLNSEEEAIKTSLKSIQLPQSLLIIDDAAFLNQVQLEDINLPDSIIYIGTDAFASKLFLALGETKIKVNELPISLKVLGGNAFYGGSENIKITRIPPNLISIGQWCFWNDVNVCITDFNQNLSKIENSSFRSCGQNLKGKSLIIRKNVVTLGDDVFREYGPHDASGENSTGITNIYFEKPEGAYGESASTRLGIAPNVNVVWGYTGEE